MISEGLEGRERELAFSLPFWFSVGIRRDLCRPLVLMA